MKDNLLISLGGRSKTSHLTNAAKLHGEFDVLYSSELNKIIIFKVLRKLGFNIDFIILRYKIYQLVRSKKYKLIVMIKPLYAKKNFLKSLRNSGVARIVYWSLDDCFLPHNTNRQVQECIPLFDRVWTTKSDNVLHARSLSYNNFRFFYQPVVYKNANELQEMKEPNCDIVFVGTFEERRCESLNVLARNGFKIKVHGTGWRQNKASLIHVSEGHLDYDTYMRILFEGRLNLIFLRALNCDQHTTRSFEIPLNGMPFLAEYSSEHLELYGTDKVLFRNNQELLVKAQQLLRGEYTTEIFDSIRKRMLVKTCDYNEILEQIHAEAF